MLMPFVSQSFQIVTLFDIFPLIWMFGITPVLYARYKVDLVVINYNWEAIYIPRRTLKCPHIFWVAFTSD